MKTIYKIYRHSKCGKIVELKLDGKEYKGYCKNCDKKVRVKEK